MQLTRHLMMMMVMVVAVCSAALIPNMMFASRGRHNQHQNQYQQPAVQHWRPGNLSPWDDGTETYGYLADRHPNMMDDLSTTGFQSQPQLQQPQQPLVYGVPHRFLSDPLTNYAGAQPSAAEELYNNALLLRGRAPFKRSSYAPFYTDVQQDDYMADDTAEMPEDYYDHPISRQDVVNFEKYVQRFFQQQQQQPSIVSEEDVSDAERQFNDDWATEERSENEMNNYDVVDNDEEAARQLHLLLNQQQQRRPIVALREIQKKNAAAPVLPATTTTSPVSPSAGTEAPLTTAATMKTSSATLLPHHQHHQGQKEEPLLRPPTPQRQPHQQQPAVPSNSEAVTTAPTVQKAKEADNNIYHTIQRLMNMRDQLQVKN